MSKILSFEDFERIDMRLLNQHYFSYKTKKIQICIERCMSGYEVAVYDLKTNLLYPRVCTALEGEMDLAMQGIDSEVALKLAMKIVNQVIKKFELEV